MVGIPVTGPGEEPSIALAERLAAKGVLVRCFTEPAALRFGLPADATGLSRLAAALDHALTGIPQ